MENRRVHSLVFLPENRGTFIAIQDGRKKIETRAGSPEYLEIKEGDTIEFSCDDEKFTKQVGGGKRYENLEELFAVYAPQEINPEVFAHEELRSMYSTFPGYEDRLKKYGILVFELA